MSKRKKHNQTKISKSTLLKLQKQANRQLELESGNHPRGGAHKTSKKDKHDRESNTVKNWEDM